MSVLLKFGTSGIRGVFNEYLDLKAMYRLCYGVSRCFQGRVGLGYDTRGSSRVLAGGVLSGLSYYGCNVTSFGVLPTPVVAFATRELGFESGLSLTASHNPPEYSGVKIFDKEGMEVGRGLEERIEKGVAEYSKVGSVKVGRISYDYTASSKYFGKIVSTLPSTSKRLKVVVDCGNGATANYTSRILSELGHHVVTVNSHQSYSSLGRVLEPNADTLKETSNLVRETQADLGIAHDGDGDRVVIIDNKGRVAQDQVLSSLALKVLLEGRRGGTVVLSVNTSSSVEKLAEKMGFRVVRSRLGKTFLEMKKVGGVLATEPSKITDSTWGMWEDGIYVATRIVQHISNSNYNLSNVVDALPTNFYYQRNIQLHGIDKARLEKNIWNSYGKDRVEEMDGWKITFDDKSLILFRISGTEPKARVYVDSPSEKRATELLKEGLKIFENTRKHGVERRLAGSLDNK